MCAEVGSGVAASQARSEDEEVGVDVVSRTWRAIYGSETVGKERGEWEQRRVTESEGDLRSTTVDERDMVRAPVSSSGRWPPLYMTCLTDVVRGPG
jgi:hypothetical protein